MGKLFSREVNYVSILSYMFILGVRMTKTTELGMLKREGFIC